MTGATDRGISEAELLRHLAESGRPVTRKTLHRWVRLGLLPEPYVGCTMREGAPCRHNQFGPKPHCTRNRCLSPEPGTA